MINSWSDFILQEQSKDYYKKIVSYIENDKRNYTIYPNKEDIFNAFKYSKLENIKCCILGQDPYHGPNQAHGLSFSVKRDTEIPPSLKNIFKELKSDLNIDLPIHGNLKAWAKQGVMLLNSSLTVREHEPNSHSKIGWHIFTDNAIKTLNEKENPLVFILWGNNARSKKSLITSNKHFIIESAHPSPLSAYNGFFGSKPFSRTNEFLINNNIEPINWNL
jgi:uracil-DNA glycosylase